MMIDMEKLQPKEVKKIFIVLVIAALLASTVLLLRITRTPGSLQEDQQQKGELLPSAVPTEKEVPPGIMIVFINKDDVKVGDSFRVDTAIRFEGEELAYSGADVILTFDPSLVAATGEVETSPLFANYPRKKVDNAKGRITVTGFGKGVDDGAQTVFTANFTTKAAGVARFDIDYVAGKTNLSTIAQKGTGKNLLGRVEGASIEIK